METSSTSSTSTELIKSVIDSMCFNCCKRMFHMQLFVVTSNLNEKNYFWLIEYLSQKRRQELNNNQLFVGCGICFGLLEKYSSNDYLKELANQIVTSGIDFNDFRISATMPNICALREKFIETTLNNVPTSEISLKICNPAHLSIKEQWKILTFHPLELIVGKPYFHQSIFDVKTIFTIEENQQDQQLLDLKPNIDDDYRKRMSKKARLQKEVQETGFTKTNVDKLLESLSFKKMQEIYTLPFARQTCQVKIEFLHDPIFLAGRYLKFSRTLPQTAWIIGGERRVLSSIEELIGNVLKKEIGATDFSFCASGREDVDVRCLGLGRPFIIEFFDPKRTIFTKKELKHYQKLVNESTKDIEVKHLQHIPRDQTKLIREGQEDKTKCYSATVYSYSALDESDTDIINEIKSLELSQKTPIRVLHRRALLARKRVVSNLNAVLIDDHHIKLKLTTQAGTYVKEFVHGDLGRTEPSLCTLLNKECDIIELDVEAVNLDFPKNVDDSDQESA